MTAGKTDLLESGGYKGPLSTHKLTICVISSANGSHVQDRGRWIAERGHRVFLVTGKKAGTPHVTELLVSPYVRIPYRYRVLHTLSLLLGFDKIIRSIKPDIIHVHFASQFFAWMLCVLDHYPLVVSVMGGDILFDEREPRPERARKLTLQLLRTADLITAKSDYLVSYVEQLTPLRNRPVKVLWGVDLEKFKKTNADALRRRLGISDQCYVILSPKHIGALYNIHLIIESMPQILEAYPDTKLLITAFSTDLGYKASIINQIESMGIQNQVIFCGEIDHDEMPQYYSLADLAIGIPTSDGLPQSLLEALACEVPHILSKLPRYEEIVSHQESAYFVDLEPGSIARGVVHLLGDARLRKSIAERGLQIVKSQANYKSEIDRVEDMYYKLVATPRKRRWSSLIQRFATLYMIIQNRRLDV